MAAPQQIEQVRLPSVCTCFPARRAVNITDEPTAILLPIKQINRIRAQSLD